MMYCPEGGFHMKYAKSLAIVVTFSLLTGCAGMTRTEQSTLSGGAIGAAGGALLSGVSGGSPAVGAVLGGAAGAFTGYLLNPPRRR
jgi:hypothetical protein